MGVAKSHDEATFYRFTCTYLVYITRVSVNKIRTENNELIYTGARRRRRASLRAARAPVRCGVDRTSRWSWFPTV